MRTFLRPALLPALLMTVFLSSGCGMLGGGDPTRLEMTDFYNLYLPLVRDVAHPDSSVAPDDARLNDIRMQWSVNHSQRYGSAEFAPGNYTSFATLWSRDLAEATLRREVTGDLSPDLQERLQEEQEDAIEDAVIFDVHMFVPATRGYDLSDTNLRGAGASVELEVGDRDTYRPSQVETSIVDHFQMGPNELPVFHRLNRVYFPRIVDEQDILDDVERIRLIVRTTRGTTNELWFTWRVRDR